LSGSMDANRMRAWLVHGLTLQSDMVVHGHFLFS
jgi:hypothetical protein